jgi:hypothetical protein
VAKKQTSSNKSTGAKVVFGKRRGGKHSKRSNKHSSVGKKYRGQGR